MIACSKTISICEKGCDKTSITEGINSAYPGDTIVVYSGTYNENVEINKPLTLLGKDTGSGKPVIDASENGNAMTISADGTTVDGFNLTNSIGSWVDIRAGIEVDSNHSNILNNLAFYNENGILIIGSNNTIRGNDAINNIYGIRTKNSGNNIIIDNNLKNNNYSLLIQASKGNIIQYNNATRSIFGILLNESSGNNLTHNQMVENRYNFGGHGNNYVDPTNLADGKPVYYLVGKVNRTIDSPFNPATIYCINCYNITINSLDLKNNLYGIYLDNTSHSFIKANILSNNRNGIALVNSYHNSIINNNAIDNINGIDLTSSRYNTLNGNKATKSQTGLYIAYSDYNRIINNWASHSENGLSLYRSYSNSLLGNDLTYNSIGAYLSFACLNKIFNNNISSNNQGILLDLSANNNLSENRIVNNTKGILFDPLDNNMFCSNNQYIENVISLEKIVSRPTASAGVGPDITIKIDSDPENANISIGGQLYGTTPGSVDLTEPGNHTIEIAKENYENGEIYIDIPEQPTNDNFPPSKKNRTLKLIHDK